MFNKWEGNKIPNPFPTQPPQQKQNLVIEAEKYRNSSGVNVQKCQDIGGGENVCSILDKSWMTYDLQLKQRRYRVEYRVSSNSNDGKFRIDTNKGKTIFGFIDVPNTQGLQKWTTISHEIDITEPISSFGLFSIKGGWNINKITFIEL